MYMRVEVGFPGCEKAVEAGGDAIWLWAAMKAYCKVNETDGRVPACMIGRLQGPDPSQQKRLVRRLVNAKLVDEVDGDFWLHDYLDWEESAEQAKSRRSAQRQRKSEWERRERERKERERNGVTGDHSNAITNGVRNGSSEGKGSVVEGSGGKLPTEEAPPAPRAERAGESCPTDLGLSNDDMASLEIAPGIPRDVAVIIATEIRDRWRKDTNKRYQSRIRWEQALLTAIRSEWSDPVKRRRALDMAKPTDEPSTKRIDGLDDVEVYG